MEVKLTLCRSVNGSALVFAITQRLRGGKCQADPKYAKTSPDQPISVPKHRDKANCCYPLSFLLMAKRSPTYELS